MRRSSIMLAAAFAASVLAAAPAPLTVCAASGEDWCGLEYSGSMELSYADQFSVKYYEGGYTRVTIGENEQEFLVVPEGGQVPEDVEEGVTVLESPVDHIYLVATSAMNLFTSLDSLDAVRLSGTSAENWYVEDARKAMEEGDILYAGKYSAPDYELIVSEGCDLAVESTMIYHTPEVKEKLESFGIPVLVERSSYESHPLGRTEWIRLYGALLGKEDAAEQIFREQASRAESVSAQENTEKTVAFFYITSNGYANVRKSDDYVAKMIEMAGGRYIFRELGEDDNALSTVNLQMEEFYAGAKDADYIIYNSTIDGELKTVEDLLAKSPLLADFKAVKDGNVWCTGKNLFQETTSIGTMIENIHTMLTSDEENLSELDYIHRLQ